MSTLRVGIVGAGGIARNHHVPSYLRCEDVQVVAACDISEAALEQMREQHGVTRLYRDYEEMLARESLDLVSICTSNDSHHPAALAAMAAGLDVFCEKPLALNLSQAVEMYEVARDRGVRTGVNFSHRRTPASMLAREIIASGALGPIHQVIAIYAAGATGYADRPGTWRNDRARAGYGGMGDMGSHILDMVNWWMDSEPVSLTAQTRTIVPERLDRDTQRPMRVTTEDQGQLLLAYANGAMGYLYGGYCFTGRGYDQRIEVYGSEGGLMYSQHHAYELEVYLPAEALRGYQVIRRGGTPDTPYTRILVPERLQGQVPGHPGVRRTVLMDYVDAYRREGPFAFSPGFLEGVKVQEVLEACTLSESRRGWVDLPLLAPETRPETPPVDLGISPLPV
jgi:predicted dehydrogenase